MAADRVAVVAPVKFVSVDYRMSFRQSGSTVTRSGNDRRSRPFLSHLRR